MICTIAVPVCTERARDPTLAQAIDLAKRTGAKLLLVATAELAREELAVELPGLEPSPVEKALPDEVMWPAEEQPPAALPEPAVMAVAECEREQVPHRVTVAYGRPASRLRDLSRLVDLVVACRPGFSAEMRLREAIGLVRAAACPVLFVAAETLIPATVAALYDGTVPSARTLRFAAELCRMANLRLHVTATASDRRRLDKLAAEAEAVAVSYGVEHRVAALRGLRPADFPAYAEEDGAQIAAAPGNGGFLRAAFKLSSLMVLAGQ